MTNDKLSLKEGKHSKNLRILILFFRGKGFDHLLVFPWYRVFSLLT